MEFSNFFQLIQIKVPLQSVVHYFGVFYDPTVIASVSARAFLSPEATSTGVENRMDGRLGSTTIIGLRY